MSGRPRAKPPKRANGEGGVTYTGQRWRARLSVGGGRRLDRLFATEDEAREALQGWRRQYLNVEFPGGPTTVGDLARDWLEERAGVWAASRTAIVSGEVELHILDDPIAHILAEKLNWRGVQVWMQQLAVAGLAWPTIRTYKQHLSSMFNWGIARGYATTNPVRLIDPNWKPRDVKPSRPIRFLMLDEAERLVAACSDPLEPWGPYFLTCAMLGLRPGEGAGIQRHAINWEAGSIHIGWSLKRIGTAPDEIGPTKTTATRTIAAPPAVLAALRRQIDNQDLARMINGDADWPAKWADLLFLNTSETHRSKTGEPVHQSNVRSHLRRICAVAGIEPAVTPYGLRHSCASILLHRKVPPPVVASMLGTSERMLRKHYHHLIDPVIREGAEVWNQILHPDA